MAAARRFWWVNQNKTYRHEVAGGYLWSPKRKRNGHLNPYYEFMREISPGDLVFSFYRTRIPSFGLATSYAYEAPKPMEFGAAGRDWSNVGWRVDVHFRQLRSPIRPSEWIDELRPLLPAKYSPLIANGRGVQTIYLTELPVPLARGLGEIMDTEVAALTRGELLRDGIAASSDAERLDGMNGLLLTPSIDHLFDRGFISFDDGGRVLVSPVAHGASLARMGVRADVEIETGPFAREQRAFLEYHRDEVFLRSRVALPT